MICKIDYNDLYEIINDDCLAHYCDEYIEGACTHFIWQMFEAIGISIKNE